MDIQNEMNMRFQARSINESFARSAVAVFAAQLDPTLEELNDIKTAVSEAVTNCIVHAYDREIGQITVRARIIGGDYIEITVADSGKGIPDIKQAMTPMFTTGGSERSGMGFTIMETFMSDLRVHTREGKGTKVKMGKRIARRLRQRR